MKQNNKTIRISESDLVKLIKECVKDIISEETIASKVKQVLEKNLLHEMAIKRGDYFNMGISQSATVLYHIGKICVYEDDVKMSHYVEHWEDEIATQIYDLGRIDVKGDNKECKIKKKAYIESFVEARLGEDFSEYDEKMPSYVIDGLEDEGLSKKQIRSIDIERIVAENKERIKNYLLSFTDLLSIKDLTELKKQCRIAAHNF